MGSRETRRHRTDCPRNIPTPCWSLTQKADKSALASKVSRIQFDATTEQLNHMMQELVAKMSGQEQDWQKLLDKLLAEMDSKVGVGKDTGQVGLLARHSWPCHRGTTALCKHRSIPPTSTPQPHLPAASSSPGVHPPAGPPGAVSVEADAGGPLEITAAAAQRAPSTLPGRRGGCHAEVRPGRQWGMLGGPQVSSA